MKLVEKMELQTVVKLDKPSFRIDYSTRLMMLGSCFVENVGAKLEYFRFKTDINPCGIVYNPLSVADTLELLLAGKRFSQADLLRNGELWVSLSHHGRLPWRKPRRISWRSSSPCGAPTMKPPPGCP